MRPLNASIFVRNREEVESVYTNCISRYHLGYVALIAWLFPGTMGQILPDKLREWTLQNDFFLCATWCSVLFWSTGILIGLWRLSPKNRECILYGRLRPLTATILGIILGFLGHMPYIGIYLFFAHHLPQPKVYGNFAETIVFSIVFGSILIPVQEEFLVHFFLQTKLQRYGAWISVVVTVVLFAIYHLKTLLRLPYNHEITILCIQLLPWLILGSLARFYTGSMLTLYVCHATFNLLACII